MKSLSTGVQKIKLLLPRFQSCLDVLLMVKLNKKLLQILKLLFKSGLKLPKSWAERFQCQKADFCSPKANNKIMQVILPLVFIRIFKMDRSMVSFLSSTFIAAVKLLMIDVSQPTREMEIWVQTKI